MENASRAILMAASILIAMIIISLLVTFFTNLSHLKQEEKEIDQVAQTTDFNKQFDVYFRNIYGSELFSLVNKIEDYNKREGDLKDYTKVELEVRITKDINDTYFKAGLYRTSNLSNEMQNLNSKISELGNTKIQFKNASNITITRSISELASMRESDIEKFGTPKSEYKQLIAQYNIYKSLLTEIKGKVFKLDKDSSNAFEYDRYTSRITKMKYKL